MEYEYKQFYRRKLPHIHSPGATLFLTFRLAGSIPKAILDHRRIEKARLDEELARIEFVATKDRTHIDTQTKKRIEAFNRRWFGLFEAALHADTSGPHWLKDERVSKLVYQSLLRRHTKVYRLRAFTIMSNHVHAVFTPLLNDRTLTESKGEGRTRFASSAPTLGVIMQSLKGYTAKAANEILGRRGAFWDVESYDHEVRNDEEYSRIIRYVLNNPVKAGLVRTWQEWRWSWVEPAG